MALLLSGIGIGYPPAFASAPYLQSGQLKSVLPEWGDELMPLHLVCAAARYVAPQVRCFFDFITARLGEPQTLAPAL